MPAQRVLAGRGLGLPSTSSLCGTPEACSCVRPRAPAASSTAVPIHTGRGRRTTAFATRAHRPAGSSVGAAGLGRNGQNAALPNSSIRAGSRVSAANTEKMMPEAAIGPSALLEFRSEKTRHSRPTVTVPAEARMGSAEALSAARTARCLGSPCVYASRRRAT